MDEVNLSAPVEPRPKFNAIKVMTKVDRYSAWFLMAVVIIYAISGYGMTKGLIDRDFARSLHFAWLGGVGIIAFVLHSFWGLRLSFLRNRIWNKYTKLLLVTFYILLVSFFLYVHFFFVAEIEEPIIMPKPAATAIAPVAGTVKTVNTIITGSDAVKLVTKFATAPAVQVSPHVFTAASLAAYDGKNGRLAYTAVDGVVYDVSSAYRDGDHHGYGAGIDLTAAFHGQHPTELLANYQIVGTYQP